MLNTQQFGKCPNVVGKSGFHGRSHPKRRVYPHHVVVREMQRDSSLEVFQLARKCIGKPSQPAKLHPQSQILSLDKASGDVFRVGMTLSHLGYSLRDWTWGVPFITELPVVSEYFCQLGIINLSPKTILD